MARELKPRRGTTAQHSAFIGVDGEVTLDTTKKALVIHDGVTAGGLPIPTFDDIASPISESVFVNVPADYATLQAALNFAQANLYINPNTIVVISVSSSFTVTQQPVINDGDMRNVIIQSAGGTVSVDTGAFIAQFDTEGTRPFMLGRRSLMPRLHGNWTAIGANAATTSFLTLSQSQGALSTLFAGLTLTGFGVGVQMLRGSRCNAEQVSITATTPFIIKSNSIMDYNLGTINGPVLVDTGGKLVLHDTVCNNSVVVSGGACTFAGTSSAVHGQIAAVGGGVVSGTVGTLYSAAGVAQLLACSQGSRINLRLNVVNNSANATVNFVNMGTAGVLSVAVGAVSTVSSGLVATLGAATHSQASICGVTAVNYTGGYSQAVDVITADGLIMAT